LPLIIDISWPLLPAIIYYFRHYAITPDCHAITLTLSRRHCFSPADYWCRCFRHYDADFRD
jgi:hypothetical protein